LAFRRCGLVILICICVLAMSLYHRFSILLLMCALLLGAPLELSQAFNNRLRMPILSQHEKTPPTELAQTPDKTLPTDSAQTLEEIPPTEFSQTNLLLNFYQWFNVLGATKQSIQLSDIQRFFAPNVELFHNGVKVASKPKGFYKRYHFLRKYIIRLQVELPFQDIIVQDDKVIIRYVLKVTKRKSPMERHQAISIFQFKDGKIIRWWEVEKKIKKLA